MNFLNQRPVSSLTFVIKWLNGCLMHYDLKFRKSVAYMGRIHPIFFGCCQYAPFMHNWLTLHIKKP